MLPKHLFEVLGCRFSCFLDCGTPLKPEYIAGCRSLTESRIKMSILVIGGSSFIGAYTVQAFLDAGYEVITTGRNARFESHYAKLGVSYRSFDLADEQGIKQLPCEDVEGVVLLAALLPANSQSDLKNEDNAWEYLEVNSVGTARLLEVLQKDPNQTIDNHRVLCGCPMLMVERFGCAGRLGEKFRIRGRSCRLCDFEKCGKRYMHVLQ